MYGMYGPTGRHVLPYVYCTTGGLHCPSTSLPPSLTPPQSDGVGG